MKRQLKKELTQYLGTGVNKSVAEKAGVEPETVRQYFAKPERISKNIEDAAFDLLEVLQNDAEEKAKKMTA